MCQNSSGNHTQLEILVRNLVGCFDIKLEEFATLAHYKGHISATYNQNSPLPFGVNLAPPDEK